jgi:hypothetical protein
MESIHPVIVYTLGDIPPALCAGIPSDSPLFQRCFYAALCGPTISDGIEEAFRRAPDPPCDEAEAEAGMAIAVAVNRALRETGVAQSIFATRSREEAVRHKCGFHAGEASVFRLALRDAGLTLIDGSEVFRENMRFLVSDAPLVVRKHSGRTLDITRLHTVAEPTSSGGSRVFALLVPPTDWSCTLLGMDGGQVELRDVPLDAAPMRLLPTQSFAEGDAKEPTEPDDLTALSPRRALALTGDLLDDEAEPLLRSMSEKALELAPERLRAVMRRWVSHLLSDQVTGRVGLFGSAWLGALTSAIGEPALAELVAQEGSRLRPDSPRAAEEAWIATAVASATAAEPDLDPDALSAELRDVLDQAPQRRRDLGMPRERSRLVVDAGWAIAGLDELLTRFGLAPHEGAHAHPVGLRVVAFIDAPKGRAYLEASSAVEGLAHAFTVCISFACPHHRTEQLLQQMRVAIAERDIARLLWQMGANGPDATHGTSVQRLLTRWQDDKGVIGDAAREARALYDSLG